MLAQVLHNLASGTRALSGRAFHVTLELDGTMLARKVHGALPHAFVAADARILPDAPARVTALKIGVAGGIAERRPAGIVSTDTREDALQLLQAVLGIALDGRGVFGGGIRRRRRKCGPAMSARVIDEQPARAGSSNGGVPERLDVQICDDKATVRVRPGPRLEPVRPVELQEELRDRAVAKLFYGSALQHVESGSLILDVAQRAEWYGENRALAL